MTYNPDKHHRRSIRLKDYDYSHSGAYFVTICTFDRSCIFGEVVNGEIWLNENGIIARAFWYEIPHHFPNVEIDKFVIMPNHVHAIILLTDNTERITSSLDKEGTVTMPLQERTLGQIMAYYKHRTTKLINHTRNTPGAPVWLRNYYEHVIRNQNDLDETRKYVENNPLQWELDKEHPNNEGAR